MRIPRELLLLHAHVGFVGWLGLMVMGVALWMFPLMRDAHPETNGRYHLSAVYGIYCLTVGGLILRNIRDPWLWRGHIRWRNSWSSYRGWHNWPASSCSSS
jgi:hypothetical protein